MSNQGLIIEERPRDIGNFLVGRLLPFSKKRMVGPFIFIDHMGPSTVGAGHYMDIGPHPHIGLSTLTYLFEGEIVHRDSLGSLQRITPGDVNWMTAGHGVVHTERTPDDWRDGTSHNVHGFQIWVALPKKDEDRDPEFFHYEKTSLPRWTEGALRYSLVAGEAFGLKSPVKTYSPLFMVEMFADEDTDFDTHGKLYGEIGICVVNGSIIACEGEEIGAGHLLVSKENDMCSFHIKKGSHLLLFGGEPFEETRYIYWNFVSSENEKIEAAKQRWRDHAFPKVEGDDGYIVMPD